MSNNQGKNDHKKEEKDLESRLVEIKRVTRVVSGGKRLSFRALVVIGNKDGQVGLGVSKGKDVSQAISKATHQAKKSTINVPIKESTIPREIKAKYGAAVVLLKPARIGRGIVAGSIVRVICELSGIENIVAKILSKSTNKINNGRATIEALKKLSR